MTTNHVLPTTGPVSPGPNYDPTTDRVPSRPFVERAVALPDAVYRPLPPAIAARFTALPKTWLGEDPTSRLGAWLHTEVGHEGRCYISRAGLAAITAIPLGLGASSSYTVGQHIQHGGLATALTHWPALNPAITLAALLAALVLCVGTALGLHGWWHHDEAPYAGNEILGLAPEPGDGCACSASVLVEARRVRDERCIGARR